MSSQDPLYSIDEAGEHDVLVVNPDTYGIFVSATPDQILQGFRDGNDLVIVLGDDSVVILQGYFEVPQPPVVLARDSGAGAIVALQITEEGEYVGHAPIERGRLDQMFSIVEEPVEPEPDLVVDLGDADADSTLEEDLPPERENIWFDLREDITEEEAEASPGSETEMSPDVEMDKTPPVPEAAEEEAPADAESAEAEATPAPESAVAETEAEVADAVSTPETADLNEAAAEDTSVPETEATAESGVAVAVVEEDGVLPDASESQEVELTVEQDEASPEPDEGGISIGEWVAGIVLAGVVVGVLSDDDDEGGAGSESGSEARLDFEESISLAALENQQQGSVPLSRDAGEAAAPWGDSIALADAIDSTLVITDDVLAALSDLDGDGNSDAGYTLTIDGDSSSTVRIEGAKIARIESGASATDSEGRHGYQGTDGILYIDPDVVVEFAA